MRRRAFHESHGGDEHVGDARILSRLRQRAQSIVECVRILPDELRRLPESKLTEVFRRCPTDVGERFEVGDERAVLRIDPTALSGR